MPKTDFVVFDGFQNGKCCAKQLFDLFSRKTTPIGSSDNMPLSSAVTKHPKFGTEDR